MGFSQPFDMTFVFSLLCVYSPLLFSQSEGVSLVSFGVTSLEVEEIDCFKMEMKLNLVIDQSWGESRNINQPLNFSSPQGKSNLSESESGSEFWSPSPFVQNSRGMDIYNLFWSQSPDGRHQKVDRIGVKIGCVMDFSLYPFDHQTCSLEFNPKNNLLSAQFFQYKLMKDDEDEVDGFERIDLHLKAMFSSSFYFVRGSVTVRNMSEVNGIFSKIVINVQVRRLWSAYFGSYFMATSSFVFISFLTLWLVYPKISVLVNFFNIILVNIFFLLHRNNLDIPKVYYVTAMDVYSSSCVFFITLVLFVNVYVLYYIKSEEEDDEDKARRRRAYDLNIRNEVKYISSAIGNSVVGNRMSGGDSRSVQEGDESLPHGPNGQGPTSWVLVKKKLMDRIRRNSHWTLLITFLLFNFIYWVTMLSIHYLK